MRCAVTGLMGDTSFAKGMLELQHHIPLLGVVLGPEIVSPVSLSLCASGGAIRYETDTQTFRQTERERCRGRERKTHSHQHGVVLLLAKVRSMGVGFPTGAGAAASALGSCYSAPLGKVADRSLL